MTTASNQRFGEEPVECRESGHYTAEYVAGLVDKWDACIDRDSRAAAEGDFFIDLLRARGARRILDVATVTGLHSVRLIEAGFEAVSLDGSTYHLHFFPLRKAYTRTLMQEVSFQHIETRGDSQETCRDHEPDFFIHVAEKAYREDQVHA